MTPKNTVAVFKASVSRASLKDQRPGRSRPAQFVVLAALSLGLTAGLWGGLLGVNPPAAIAYTSRLSLFLSRDQEESYEALLRRAEITARAGVQRSFDADVLVSAVTVTVVAENQGISVPVLTVAVTRDEWRERPDVEYWARYYSIADALLGF